MNVRRLALVAALGTLSACGGDTKDTDTDTEVPVDDTGPGGDDTGEAPCTTTVLSMEPADGTADVYYRDALRVSFEGDGSSADIVLTEAGGDSVLLTENWAEGNVQVDLSPTLEANTTYTLSVDVCGTNATSTFTTSSLGAPLAVAPSDLVGRTYVFRLSDADITEPVFLDVVASSYLTVPLLISVTSADETSIDLLGALGELDDMGNYTQLRSEATWDFPAGDFSEQPYFEAYADRIVLTYSGIDIPIEQFNLSGTFSADGSSLEEGIGTGFGDSRYMGPLVGADEDDYAAICDIAAGAGVECVPCADGEPYCMYIVAEEISAAWEEGLTLTPVE